MTDPSVGMKSFQQALRRGEIDIHVAKTGPKLFVHLDAPSGPPRIRYTYVRLKGKTVTAMVIFAAEPPIKGNFIFPLDTQSQKHSKIKAGRKKSLLQV